MKLKAMMLPAGIRIDWGQLERSIHDRFGVNAIALDKAGGRRTAGAVLWANGLCELIKTDAIANEKICEILKRQMMQKARAIRAYVTQECAAGIYRRLFPVIKGDDIQGYVSVCGRPFSTRQLIYADYIHETTGADREKVERLISTLIPIDPRSIQKMTAFITSVTIV